MHGKLAATTWFRLAFSSILRHIGLSGDFVSGVRVNSSMADYVPNAALAQLAFLFQYSEND